jgi:hypothetical protein
LDRQHRSSVRETKRTLVEGTAMKDLQAAAAILLHSQRHTSRCNRELQLRIAQRVPADADTLRVCADIFLGAKTTQKRAQNVHADSSCASVEGCKVRDGSQDLRAEIAEPAPCRNLPSAMRWSAFGASS